MAAMGNGANAGVEAGASPSLTEALENHSKDSDEDGGVSLDCAGGLSITYS
jgi:hypothetical protein